MNKKMIDLTLPITHEMKVFLGSPQPIFLQWSKYDNQGYDSEVMFLSTHTGTHIDAPSHFSPKSQTIDQISIDRFVCSSNHALLLTIEKQQNDSIKLEDIIKTIEKNDQVIKENDSVIFYTRWEEKYMKSDRYMIDNPGLSKEAAEYLVERKINAVGIDSPSIDIGSDTNFSAHKILCSQNIIIIENLCNLSRILNSNDNTAVNSRRFDLIAIPLKLGGASGSPIRAVGIVYG
jgi:arylformamidase